MSEPNNTSIRSLEPQVLASCINALGSAHFTSSLIKLLHSLVAFDCAVIVGYRPGKHPIYLYDSLQQQRELLFQRYLLHTYQQDPFLVQLGQQQEEGDVGHSDHSIARRGSYRRANWVASTTLPAAIAHFPY